MIMSKECLRCHKEMPDDLVMEVTNPKGGDDEIACLSWCAKCNAEAMSALLRESSIYWKPMSRPPWQHES